MRSTTDPSKIQASKPCMNDDPLPTGLARGISLPSTGPVVSFESAGCGYISQARVLDLLPRLLLRSLR
ncbi:RB-associated KRAB zinc finger protein [Fusarium oxysporum f. sp. albedinis]|nr:RB-associated KRAB zinc finger protein [Fusarium oxysporum f. sp. albedinis]